MGAAAESGNPTPAESAGIPDGNLRAGLAWYGVAHGALLAAALVLLAEPELATGAWQRPRLVAAVHLITLGWVAASVVGSLVLLGQGVLRLGLVAGRRELWAAPVWALLLIGLVARLETVDPPGLAAAAIPLVLALAAVLVIVLRRVVRAPLPGAMRFALVLAWSNLALALAGALFVVAGRLGLPSPGAWPAWRLAHAHLAAVGWATTLVAGVGARMLPMVLPAAPPPPRALAAVAALLGFGTPAFAACLVGAPDLARWAALLPAAGALGWVALVGWMLAHPRPPAKELPRPDAARWLAVAAAALLALAALAGAALAFAPSPPAGLAVAYGALGLAGFLGGTILAVELRLLPTVAWVLARRRIGFDVPFPSAHRLPPHRLALAAAAAMALAAPLIAAGALAASPALVRLGAALLVAAPLLHAGVVAAMLRAGRDAAA